MPVRSGRKIEVPLESKNQKIKDGARSDMLSNFMIENKEKIFTILVSVHLSGEQE